MEGWAQRKKGGSGNRGLLCAASFCAREGCMDVCFLSGVSVRGFLGGFVSLTTSLWAPQHSAREGSVPKARGEWNFLGEERIPVSGGMSMVHLWCFLLTSYEGACGSGTQLRDP